MVPVAISEHAAVIEGLAPDRTVPPLDAAFKCFIGFEADIGVREVTDQQCPPLAFWRGSGKPRAHLDDIDREALRNGDGAQRNEDHDGAREVALFLVRYRHRAESQIC